MRRLFLSLLLLLALALPSSAPAFTSTVGGGLEASGNLDTANAPLDPLWYCRVCVGSATWNGTNGARGDSTTIETANSGPSGASFFFPITSNCTHATRGSLACVFSTVNMTDGGASSPPYREANAYLGTLTTDSKGAYGGTLEMSNTIVAGKPARATAGTFSIDEHNALSAYNDAVFGSGSPWSVSGARALWLVSQDHGQPTGTGLFLQGAFGHGVYAYQGSASMPVVASRIAGETTDRFQLLADGSFVTSGTVTMRNAAATPPVPPAGSGTLFVQAGALKYRGPSGTITTLAPA